MKHNDDGTKGYPMVIYVYTLDVKWRDHGKGDTQNICGCENKIL